MKTIPMSVRLSQEDAEFLSQLEIEGAATPSDRLRAIIGEARLRRSRPVDYLGCYQMLREQLAPVSELVRQAELENNNHSEVLARSLEWLPDFFAFLVSAVHSGGASPGEKELTAAEQGVADRVFRLMESFTQMAVTERCPCYMPALIRERIKPLLDLTTVITNNMEK